MSYGEPIALRGQAELEHPAVAVALGDGAEARAHPEAQFIERLKAGEAAAFDHLVNERSADIYALLYRLTQDAEEARDLTQETFLQAFRSIAHFRGEADLRTWLYRIAVNQARNRWRWWRRRRRSVTVSLDSTDETHELSLATRLMDERAEDPEAHTLAHEREQILLAAVQTLGRPFREAVVRARVST